MKLACPNDVMPATPVSTTRPSATIEAMPIVSSRLTQNSGTPGRNGTHRNSATAGSQSTVAE